MTSIFRSNGRVHFSVLLNSQEQPDSARESDAVAVAVEVRKEADEGKSNNDDGRDGGGAKCMVRPRPRRGMNDNDLLAGRGRQLGEGKEVVPR